MIEWLNLSDDKDLEEIIKLSSEKPCVIFKHSTRCSISGMAKNRLEREWQFTKEELPIYYLDLISYRNLSNKIAEKFRVQHESPQLLLIRDGECIYDASHNGISAKSVQSAIGN